MGITRTPPDERSAMAPPISPLTQRLAEVIAPLSPDEERRAIQAALKNVQGERLHVYGAELRIDKRRAGVPARLITVFLADLAGYMPYEVVVDADGEIVEANEQPDRVPPFSPSEIGDALALARSVPEVVELGERWGVTSAVFYPTSHDDGDRDAAGRRRVGFHFLDISDETAVTPVASIVVDLTAGEVESVNFHPLEA
jgi:hypothetical protein